MANDALDSYRHIRSSGRSMFINTVEDLLTVLRRGHLFTPEQVEEVGRELGSHYDDPYALGLYLVEIEWLTAFQLETLFNGNPNELNVGPYQLLDKLGEGGMSRVYKAWDSNRGRIVAIKMLRPDLISHTDALQQLQREMVAVSRLNHLNVIKTYEAEQIGEQHYFVMEYVEGMDLHRLVEQSGQLPVDLACEYIRQVAQGLQHAHQLGLVHRDIKPANLLLINPPVERPGSSGLARRGPEPIVKILDWGLARTKPNGEETTDLAMDHPESHRGTLIGTADFVSPEQARDPTMVDIRADIYSLGCTFYFLLAGTPPFTGASVMQKLLQHQEQPPPAIQALRPDVPDPVNAILLKMMSKSPEERFQIPLLVGAALRHFCPNAIPTPGSVIRPPSSSNLNVSAPPTSSALAMNPNGNRGPNPPDQRPH